MQSLRSFFWQRAHPNDGQKGVSPGAVLRGDTQRLDLISRLYSTHCTPRAVRWRTLPCALAPVRQQVLSAHACMHGRCFWPRAGAGALALPLCFVSSWSRPHHDPLAIRTARSCGPRSPLPRWPPCQWPPPVRSCPRAPAHALGAQARAGTCMHETTKRARGPCARSRM